MNNDWYNLTSDEKLKVRLAAWLKADGIEFTSGESKIHYQLRVQRFIDALQLKIPDRVPVYVHAGFFPARYSNITTRQAMTDYALWGEAWKKYVFDFAPDSNQGSSSAGSGKAMEYVDYQLYSWPGHGLPENASFQCVEAEYMKADEYDNFIECPGDFLFRKYLARVCPKLASFQKLPSAVGALELPGFLRGLAVLGDPAVQEALKTAMAAGSEAARWSAVVGSTDRAVNAAGFPNMRGAGTKAPLDAIGDTLRGTVGIIKDMYRQPAKLKIALDKLTPLLIAQGVSAARLGGSPLVFMPLHKGADGFMSDKQFREFYWPSLKEVILGLIDEGLIPWLFAEGGFESRLEIIRELPPGKTVWLFDQTDMLKAKMALQDTACIMGNVPSSLLITGSLPEVKNYCQKLIDTAGRGGGYILSNGAVLDNAKPENVKAMIESAKEYGVYGR